MLRHLSIRFSLHYMSSTRGRFREVKDERKFQIFSSNSGHSRLQEVVADKRFQI